MPLLSEVLMACAVGFSHENRVKEMPAMSGIIKAPNLFGHRGKRAKGPIVDLGGQSSSRPSYGPGEVPLGYGGWG